MKAILSNVNLDPIAAAFQPEPIYSSSYGQLVPELLDPTSGAHGKEIDAALVFIDGEELFGPHLDSLPGDAPLVRADEILAAVEVYAERLAPVPVVVSTIVLPPNRFIRFLEANTVWSFGAIAAEINGRLRGLRGRCANVLILDWERLVLELGYENLHDDRFYYLGRVKLNRKGLGCLCVEFGRLLSAFRDPPRKVLVLDADNTLWGGVVGEDGVGGIALSEDGIRKAYRDFQRAVRSVRELGILLVLSSKNNEADVDEVLEKHPMMVLRAEDFVVRRVDWTDKATHLREVAAFLGLGLEAFVVIDDSAVERHLLKTHMREVAVPDFPPDPALLKRWFLREVVPAYFGRVAITTEDRVKTEQYAGLARRRDSRKGLDLEEFIASLDIHLDISFNAPEHRLRVAQLTQKTNQFNLTTRRYTEVDIERFLVSPDVDVATLTYADRFGQEGVVGAAIVCYSQEIARIDTFLLSCRVIGRRVEHALLRALVVRAAERGVTRIEAEFIPTERNAVTAGFYESAGFVGSDGLYQLAAAATGQITTRVR